MRTLITICARGGSKGIPGKNIKLLAGRPLIEYTIDLARQFKNKYVDVDIALSTDNEEILDVALSLGHKENYRRPGNLATDTAGKISTVKDVLFWYEELNQLKYDYILDLDVTSPLRNLLDLSIAFQIIRNDNNAYNLFSVSPANRNPYFNMVEMGDNGYYHVIKKTTGIILSRQTAPKVFDMNSSFYFYRRLFFDLDIQSTTSSNSLIYEVPHICFDLDHTLDFEFLSFLIGNNKLDFDL